MKKYVHIDLQNVYLLYELLRIFGAVHKTVYRFFIYLFIFK